MPNNTKSDKSKTYTAKSDTLVDFMRKQRNFTKSVDIAIYEYIVNHGMVDAGQIGETEMFMLHGRVAEVVQGNTTPNGIAAGVVASSTTSEAKQAISPQENIASYL